MRNVNRSCTRGTKIGMTMTASLCVSAATLPAAEKTPPTAPGHGPLSLVEKHGEAYVAPLEPTLVNIYEAQYLTLAGTGAPSGAEFVRKVGTLYGVAYTLKMKSRSAGQDYGLAPLEALWWGSKNPYDFFAEPRETWKWKLLLRAPAFMTETQVREVAAEIAAQRKDADSGEIKLEKISEGRCVQMLHVGPYSEEGKTIAAMMASAKTQGLVQSGYHHEIYLSDPQRTDPKDLRTILRLPVKPEAD